MGATANFWDRIGVYVVIAGLFAGCAALMVLLTQHLMESNPTLLALQSQAENGNAQSQYMLGDAYLSGNFGLKRDVTQAKYWLRKAEAQHFVEAGCELATIRFNGRDQTITDAEAMQWFQEGVDAHDIECMNNAAWFKATLPDAALRDPQAAERIEQDVLRMRPHVPGYMDTLAAAYAAEGRFEQAVAEQELAMDRLKLRPGNQTAELNDMGSRLQLYQQHQPYVLTMPATAATTQKSTSTGGGS